jgi:monoterpene epsilon-lactone hydrolase
MKLSLTRLAAGVALFGCAGVALAQASGWTPPTFAPDGTVQVKPFELPPSGLSSPEAQAAQKARGAMRMPGGGGSPVASTDINATRRGIEMYLAPQVESTKSRYPANIVEQRMGGVRVRVITPKSGKVDPRRVLINLHGGGFNQCAEACAMIESLTISSIGGFKVVTVDYRQGPEFTFPAASEDVAKVYRELLKTYKPKQIGIYGCSAGGALTGEVGAWLPAHGLPQAGALGIFGAGAVRFGAGDSAWIAAYIDGSLGPPPPKPGTPPAAPPPGQIRSYFEGADMNDPMISPALHPDVLRKFPPTLVITGTRAMDMSPAIFTHSKLVDVGVPGDLIVGEGMGHCYVMQPQLPEAQAAYRAIVRFFRTHLG